MKRIKVTDTIFEAETPYVKKEELVKVLTNLKLIDLKFKHLIKGATKNPVFYKIYIIITLREGETEEKIIQELKKLNL